MKLNLLISAAIALCATTSSVFANVRTEAIIRQNLINAIDSDLVDSSSLLADAVDPVKTLFFDQSLDHFGSVNGTFKQKYFVNDQFYKPGGPIIVYIEGESPASARRLSSPRMNLQYLAQTYNGLLVSLEHRYYSPDSVPTKDISNENLPLLSSRQAIKDSVNFLAWFRKDRNVPDCTKVIGVGGSYPGNMAAYFRVKHPEVFFAAQASSAPVNPVMDFRQYSKAVRLGLANPIANGNPQCSAGVAPSSNSTVASRRTLKKTREEFGLKHVVNIGVQYGPTFAPYNSEIDMISSICDGKLFPEFTNPNATDAALYDTLKTWYLKWMVDNGMIPNDYESTYSFNADYYVGTVDAADPRANMKLWMWQVCTEYGYFQTAEFIHKPAYSKYVTKEYFSFICETIFGPEHREPDVAATLAYWGTPDELRSSNLIWTNGRVDPWSYLSVVHRRSRNGEFVFWHDQFHCFDLYAPRDTDTVAVTQIKKDVNDAWKAIMSQDTCAKVVAGQA
ncbi:serine carboxypeptidase S28-domain-containing protein [Chytridium lagenaria]|nr:serine carboxypeptidase S28-domain-containing protein [Chytridium lagenaria]